VEAQQECWRVICEHLEDELIRSLHDDKDLLEKRLARMARDLREHLAESVKAESEKSDKVVDDKLDMEDKATDWPVAEKSERSHARKASKEKAEKEETFDRTESDARKASKEKVSKEKADRNEIFDRRCYSRSLSLKPVPELLPPGEGKPKLGPPPSPAKAKAAKRWLCFSVKRTDTWLETLSWEAMHTNSAFSSHPNEGRKVVRSDDFGFTAVKPEVPLRPVARKPSRKQGAVLECHSAMCVPWRNGTCGLWARYNG